MPTDADTYNELAKPGLEALSELLDKGVGAYAPAAQDIRPFQVGWGLVAALQRQAAAVVALHSKGLAHEAAPNRRLMIEYVAHLQWLARDGEDAVDSMNKAFQYKHAGIRRAADASGCTYDEEAANAVRDAEIPGNPANQFSNMSKLLGRLGGGLHTSWLGETQLSHATLTAAGCFYRSTDAGLELLDAPAYGIDGDPMEYSPYIAFFLLLIGMIAFNDLLVGSPWANALRAVSESTGLSGAI